jgi:signal transduction histidine kinase
MLAIERLAKRPPCQPTQSLSTGRLMQLLPTLHTAAGPLKVPIADATAAWLAAALVDGDHGCSPETLTDVLACDPAFVLWAVCNCARWSPLGSLSQLAAELAPELLERLVGTAASAATNPIDAGATHAMGDEPLAARDEPPAVEASDGALQAWSHFVGEATATAEHAAAIARHCNLAAEEACFLGFFATAPHWLATMGAAAEVDSIRLLPEWLAARLSAVESHAGAVSSVEGAVAAARDWTHPGRCSATIVEGLPFDRESHEAQIAAAREQWLARRFAPALAPLVRKLQRLRSLEEQFRATLELEKLESLKELAYGAGHEINNPLANISARAQTLLQLERDPERRRLLATINSQALRAHEMIADMMLFARPPQPKLDAVDVARVVAEVVGELLVQAGVQGVEIVFPERPAAVFVRADKTQIAVAVRAVCVNAIEACLGGGRIEIEIRQSAPVRKSVQITISDNGPGIPETVRPHIFDPFFSGREAGRGLGFGLSKCWRIVTMHGGRIEVENQVGGGARFTISLPGNGDCS